MAIKRTKAQKEDGIIGAQNLRNKQSNLDAIATGGDSPGLSRLYKENKQKQNFRPSVIGGKVDPDRDIPTRKQEKERVGKLKDKKDLARAKGTLAGIGKSKKENFTMAPNNTNSDLAKALRFKQDLSDSMSDADVLRQYRNKGISGKKMGGAKMPITQLPTNVPRLKRGSSIIGDLDKNGRMSGYEQARQKAIEKNMK
jgi:hypothetical protein